MLNSVEFYIIELLVEHDMVVIPGFGGFIARHEPARIHPVRHTFIPPSRQLAFNRLLNKEDGLLKSQIAASEKISYAEAEKVVKLFINKLQSRLEKEKRIELDGLGVLRKDWEGNLDFNPVNNAIISPEFYGLDTFVSPAIIREEALEEKEEAPLVEMPQATHSYRRIGWVAAAVIPFAAIAVWASLNLQKIEQKGFSYSDLNPLPFLKELVSPEAEQQVLPVSPNANEPYYLAYGVQEEAERSAEIAHWQAEVPFVSEALAEELELKRVSEELETELEPEIEVIPSSEDKFFIIGNCFSKLSNAERFVDELKGKGFSAARIIGQSSSGLHRVCYEGYASEAEAEEALSEIRQTEKSSAWLLEL